MTHSVSTAISGVNRRDLAAGNEIISAGDLHTVGLRADGKAVATGSNQCGQCDVSSWKLATEPLGK